MTFLRELGYLQLTEPSGSSVNHGNLNKSYYSVEFDWVMILEGRNLRYEARWPPADQLDKYGQTQTVRAFGQVCIAAAFRPGTSMTSKAFVVLWKRREILAVLDF